MATNNSNPNNGKLRLHDEVELPIDGLPLFVQEYINEVERVYKCPREFQTVAVFSAIATVVGKRLKVTDKKYINPLMLWFVNVAISGSNKTQPVKEVLKPLREINHKNHLDFDEKYNKWKAGKRRDEDEMPSFNQLLVGDCTEEARIKILKSSFSGVLGYYPEIKGFFDDMERYNKGGYVDKLLRLFDGDDIILNRKGENRPIVIRDVFMNILGDIQPGLLKATFGSQQFMENGLNQRFLFTMPHIETFPQRSKEAMDSFMVDNWFNVINKLYEYDFTDCKLVSFSPECDSLYNDYFNSLQEKKAHVKATTEDGYLLSVYSKLQIQAQRLAGIIHVTRLIQSPNTLNYNYYQVTAEEMEYTIRCMDYFEKSAITVYERICDIVPQGRDSSRSQAQIIRDFNKDVPIKNRTAFAEAIGKDPSYITRVLKG